MKQSQYVQEFKQYANDIYGDKEPLKNIKFVIVNGKVMGILDYQGLTVTHILNIKEGSDDCEVESKITDILIRKWLLEIDSMFY